MENQYSSVLSVTIVIFPLLRHLSMPILMYNLKLPACRLLLVFSLWNLECPCKDWLWFFRSDYLVFPAFYWTIKCSEESFFWIYIDRFPLCMHIFFSFMDKSQANLLSSKKYHKEKSNDILSHTYPMVH